MEVWRNPIDVEPIVTAVRIAFGRQRERERETNLKCKFESSKDWKRELFRFQSENPSAFNTIVSLSGMVELARTRRKCSIYQSLRTRDQVHV